MTPYFRKESPPESGATGRAANVRRAGTDPLSPAARLGGALPTPIPPILLQPPVTALVNAIHRCHPEIHARMKESGLFSFAIAPVELPLRFILRFDEAAPRLVVVRAAGEEVRVDAVIRGRLLDLVDLLQARTDGDALFFSRALTIEGDIEAVLTLRNAIENAEIDLAAALGPLGGVTGAGLRAIDCIARRAARDFERVRSTFVGDVERDCAQHTREIQELKAQLAALRARIDGRAKEAGTSTAGALGGPR